MDGYHRLDALQQRVAQVARDVPGARALYLFGSRIIHPTDPYADLDLQIVTEDIVTARRFWPHMLERVAPIRVAWPITDAGDNTAFAIEFHGESLYHKVDIGLSPLTEPGSDAALDGRYRLLWEQVAPIGKLLLPPTQAFIPAYVTVGHALMNDLLGSVRYVKARKRQQPLTCWRFIRGKPNLLFQLYAEQQQQWQADLPPLDTWTYKALDQQGTDEVVAAALAHLNWSTPELMDASFSWFTKQLARLFVEKAVARAETIPQWLVAEHLAFIASELPGATQGA